MRPRAGSPLTLIIAPGEAWSAGVSRDINMIVIGTGHGRTLDPSRRSAHGSAPVGEAPRSSSRSSGSGSGSSRRAPRRITMGIRRQVAHASADSYAGRAPRTARERAACSAATVAELALRLPWSACRPAGVGPWLLRL
eukprot:scaffold260_cov328-Prasinococcus_capsulatus_cf.AAC.23